MDRPLEKKNNIRRGDDDKMTMIILALCLQTFANISYSENKTALSSKYNLTGSCINGKCAE